jgi:hypothetical protein
MSNVTCKQCGTTWDATLRSECPQCLRDAWMNTPDFLRRKHDPQSLSSPYPRDRSIVSSEYIQGSAAFLGHAAQEGTACYSVRHRGYCYLADSPGGAVCGSAVPASGTIAAHPHHGIIIAGTAKRAHIYTEDPAKMWAEFAAGSYIPQPQCEVVGCSNLAIPGDSKCVIHISIALAD